VDHRSFAITNQPGSVIAVSGELDLYTAPELRDHLREAVCGESERVVVDMREVTFMDSSGLAAIFTAWRSAGALDRELVIVADGDAVRRPLALAAMDELVPVLDSEQFAAGRALTAPR
jgi:anti-sigma B factor antagonist